MLRAWETDRGPQYLAYDAWWSGSTSQEPVYTARTGSRPPAAPVSDIARASEATCRNAPLKGGAGRQRRATMPGVRLFVALTPPADVIEELQAKLAALRELEQDVRWSRPEQWHLTLAFLGEVGDEARGELAVRLGRAARRHSPLLLSFGGSGRFGHRVLWTRVRGQRDGLLRLADSVRAAARRSGLPTEQRPYRPHLTVARATSTAVDLRPLVDALAPHDGRCWQATELHLVQSRLGAGPGGTALHEPVASWALGEP